MSLNFAPFELLPEQTAEQRARGDARSKNNNDSLENFLKQNPYMKKISPVNLCYALLNCKTYYRNFHSKMPQIYSYDSVRGSWNKLNSGDYEWDIVLRHYR